MDAIGATAPEPDDEYLFRAIVADVDGEAIARAATVPPAPEPTAAPPTTPPSAPVPTSDQEPTAAPPPPASTALALAAPSPPAGPPPLPPRRPELVEPTRPAKPDLGKVEQSGHRASAAGYALSVAVGAAGQILFLGTWLGTAVPAPLNWVAAVIGAAFAEIGMIGAGNSSLARRRDGGRWKLLFAVACLVCTGAVVMQVTHWLPEGIGLALVFGLASFVGFLIHMTIEHSRIRDYEDSLATYEEDLALFRQVQQARYEEDLALYQASRPADREPAARPRPPAPAQAAPTAPSKPAARRKPKAGRQKAGTPTAGKVDALRIGVEQRVHTPAPLRQALIAAGFALPASSTTVETWCKEIKAELGITST